MTTWGAAGASRLHQMNGPVPMWAFDAPALNNEADYASVSDEFRRRGVLIPPEIYYGV